MSKYTTEVRYICETENHLDESVGYKDVDAMIAGAIPGIFSFDFPIFDANYRNVLCTKILRHYYTREIGFETVGLWKLKLQTKLNEIMPYYNQLYESQLIKFNPLYDTELRTTNVGNKDSETNKSENRSTNSVATNQKSGNNDTAATSGTITNAKSTDEANTNRTNVQNTNDGNTHYDLYSDTPQGGLTGVDAETYLTNARKITDAKNASAAEAGTEKTEGETNNETNAFSQTNSNNVFSESDSETRSNAESATGSDKFTSTENYLIHVSGKQSGNSFSKMLMEFRDTFLNIDMDVIDSLADLFLNLW